MIWKLSKKRRINKWALGDRLLNIMRSSTYINFLNKRSIMQHGDKALCALKDMERIIKFLSQGDSYDDVSKKKAMSTTSIRRLCVEIREHFHCETDAELVYKYTRGEIDVFKLI